MIARTFAAALLAPALAAPAHAQGTPGNAELAAEIAAMRAKIATLEAEVAALKAAPASASPAVAEGPPAASPRVPTSGGTPTASSSPAGGGGGGGGGDKVTLRPFGRLQYDVGHVSSPRGIADRGLGFASEVRRARIGVEGSIPGGFGYKFEVDFADNEVEVTDAFLNYKASKSLGFTLGQHNNFQSLEELTSSRFLSFMERAAFTDAFNFERRLGLSATWSAGDAIVQAGVFTSNIDDLSGSGGAAGLGGENDAAGLDARLVYAPRLGAAQLHLGASAHWRDNNDVARFGPAIRYRQRPFVHTSDTRFISTPGLRVGEETGYGLEAALIRGPLHATGELHWLSAETLTAGVRPGFFGGYAELGYYLTGETRGYKGGRWDRTKVLKPVGGGGLGAVQLNLRYDHLDLSRRRRRRRPPAGLRSLSGLDPPGPCPLPRELRLSALRGRGDPGARRRHRLWRQRPRRPRPGRLLGLRRFRQDQPGAMPATRARTP
jgi:phosphate-selective porin OprO/OprP